MMKSREINFEEFKEITKKMKKKSQDLTKEMGFLVWCNFNVYIKKRETCDVISVNPYDVDLKTGKSFCEINDDKWNNINFRKSKIFTYP